MITAHYDRAGCRLRLQGHGGGKPGQDLVCAAASILAFTLAANLQELERRGRVTGVRVYLRPGCAAFAAAPSPDARAALDFTATGLRLLAKQYNQRVKLGEEKPPS